MEEIVTSKICSKCKENKSLEEFGNSKSGKFGKKSACKVCMRDDWKTYYNNNKEKVIEKNKKYDIENPDKAKNRFSKYSKSENRKEYIKEYYEKEENREKRRERSKEYIKQDVVRKKRTDYMRERKRVDELFRLRCNVSSYISSSIRGINSKNGSSIDMLGLSIDEYKKYLSSLFTEGMNWDNYGEWHIDHKRPVCSFDLSSDIEMMECFNYKNTQPLWAEDNLRKGGKWDGDI